MLDMYEYGVSIDGFPDYEVTNYGRIFNIKTNREMILSPTAEGDSDLSVGLYRNHRQYRLSVKVLVAKTFVDGYSEIFNTPIQLDGDKTNLRSDNMVWRPRWFAWRYTHQFKEIPDWYHYGPLIELRSQTSYNDYLEAAMVNGILCEDIRTSVYAGSRVFPTGQIFGYDD